MSDEYAQHIIQHSFNGNSSQLNTENKNNRKTTILNSPKLPFLSTTENNNYSYHLSAQNNTKEILLNEDVMTVEDAEIHQHFVCSNCGEQFEESVEFEAHTLNHLTGQFLLTYDNNINNAENDSLVNEGEFRLT